MISPRHPSDQRCFANCGRLRVSDLADEHVCNNVTGTDGAQIVQGAIRHEDHTPSPLGQRTSALASLPDFLDMWLFQHDTEDISVNPEPNAYRTVGQRIKRSEGTGRCRSEQSFSRLARQPGLPLAATRSPSNRLPVPPLARAPQQSPAGRFCKALPLGQRVMSPIASLTPANVAATEPRSDPSILTAPLAPRARGAVFPSLNTGTAQPRLTRLFALPASVKGSADV